MKRSVSIKRDYHMMMPSGLFPMKDGDRSFTVFTKCDDEGCEEEIPMDVERIQFNSEGGFNIDIETPHELRFNFDGEFDCINSDDRMECFVGDPAEIDVDVDGEFVRSFESDDITIHNFPIRHPWQFGIYTGLNLLGPLALMSHPFLAPIGIGALFLEFPFLTVGPASIISAEAENRRNHWYLNGMDEDIHELHISPEKIKSVEYDARHDMLATANIHFDDTLKCDIWAVPSGISERRKLYCR